ncbi:MAG: UbiA family prenyltransferase, partial [Armatimonadota bacterium]
MIRAVFLSLRPRQWTKNLVIFAAVLFVNRFTDAGALLKVGAAFIVFCLLSGGVYLLNDLHDAERDRLHPIKRHRPVASGALS